MLPQQSGSTAPPEVGGRRVPRLGILLSGRGSNLLALHAAIVRGELPAAVGLVVSNVPEAPGLARARDLGLPAVAIPHRGEPGRAAHEQKVLEALREAAVDWVCLAGYMRLLSPAFIAAFARRIVNIHPSLLPAFPGLEAQAQALAHGVRIAGCTVHLVDESLDGGPIVVQRAVPVLEDDTVRILSERILEQEHAAYPEALRRLLTESWRIEERRLVFPASATPPPGPARGTVGCGHRGDPGDSRAGQSVNSPGERGADPGQGGFARNNPAAAAVRLG
ncbi:MAG: phosphoribosylglycinamide formyltransferase [Acidobacteriota bacterium]|nr:phosphoribosylglycinamide formyltransferase [Acidobacteriota bacterium]